MDILPDFFLDYREKLSTDTRWTDRVAAHDATWSGTTRHGRGWAYGRETKQLERNNEMTMKLTKPAGTARRAVRNLALLATLAVSSVAWAAMETDGVSA